MADYEQALDIEKFLYSMSAFMCSFRTIAYRLYGVTENTKGRAASLALRSQLHSHPEIGFLLGRSNVEVHEDGVLVHHRYTVHVTASIPDRWKSKFDLDKWQSKFKPKYSDGIERVEVRRAAGWQFAGKPKNLIELCDDALDAIEEYARQALVAAST
jgi:hypothetical protein